MRVGVFGGSFDPVHRGHLIVAAAAADALALDQVRFIPAAEHALKGGRYGASAGQRAAMLRLALAGADPRFLLDERELDRPGPSYTIDTLRELRAAFPADGLFLLVGADAARDLPQWREAGALAELATVVVLSRPGAALPGPGVLARAVAVPAVEISASDVRARCAEGRPIDELVPPAVARYVADRGLYLQGA